MSSLLQGVAERAQTIGLPLRHRQVTRHSFLGASPRLQTDLNSLASQDPRQLAVQAGVIPAVHAYPRPEARPAFGGAA